MTDTEKAEQIARDVEGWVAYDELTADMQRAVVWLLRKCADAQKETPDLSDRG